MLFEGRIRRNGISKREKPLNLSWLKYARITISYLLSVATGKKRTTPISLDLQNQREKENINAWRKEHVNKNQQQSYNQKIH